MSRFDPAAPAVVAFMRKASDELGVDLSAPKDIFDFGMGNARLSDKLLEITLRGEKTATTS